MFSLAFIVWFGLVQCSVYAADTKTSAVESLNNLLGEETEAGREDGGCRRIVINSASTNIQVSPNGNQGNNDAADLQKKLEAMQLELDTFKTEANNKIADLELNASGGSVYTRWGSKTCPESAQLMYSGVVGGSYYTHSGGAANALCLPLNPVYDGHPVPQWGPAYIYGAEFQIHPEPKNEQDPLCAVCLSPRPYTVMIPATNTCQPGWTTEYTGYIMAGNSGYASAAEYICMDAGLDTRIGSHSNHEGYLLYYTVSKCGSLPCPPFQEGKVVTCVVCSK